MKNIVKAESLIREHKYWRVLESIPGLLTWSAFLLVLVGSYFQPFLTANVIIIYTLVWVFRSFIFSYHLAKSYRFSSQANRSDWKKLCDYIENPTKLEQAIHRKDFKISPVIFKDSQKAGEKIMLGRIKKMQASGEYLKPSEILHIIMIPTYKEPFQIIKASIDSYLQSDFDLKKVIILMTYEERDKENALLINDILLKEYGGKFGDFLWTIHPKDLPNEHPGKGSNSSWGAKFAKQYFEKKRIPFHKVVLSNFDADTVISANYLSELTFRYCITENRVEVGYQPVPFFHNNFWEVPIVNRLVALSSSFWQWSVSLRKDENKSFSSRAMSFASVMDFGYWDSAVVQDDSRQYWTALFVYEGRHYLENIYSPVFMDAVQSENYVKTIKSQYIQLLRWAWGAGDFPFIVFNIMKCRGIPLWRKIYEPLHFLESVFFWATGPILLIFSGSIPGLLSGAFRESVLSYNLPNIMSTMLNISLIGIVMCLFITLRTIPLDKKVKFSKRLSIYFQWALVPIVSITLSALPAIDAQTRLLFNKRLDFVVTKKTRNNIKGV